MQFWDGGSDNGWLFGECTVSNGDERGGYRKGRPADIRVDDREKGIAFRGTVQKNGVKAATATGFDFTAYGLGTTGGFVTGRGSARRINVNYGYVFLGEGTAEGKRALCLFEPDNVKEAASLIVGAMSR